jgi:uncharacterized protein (TIRG00374 family)
VPGADLAARRNQSRRRELFSYAPRPALLLAGLAISAFCLWLALRGVAYGDVWASLGAADWKWLVPTLLLIYLTLAIRAFRWRFLFDDPNAVSAWEAARALNIGLMFNSILPSRVGEVPRVVALARATGVSKLETGATIVVERALDVVAVAALGVALWPWLPREPWIDAMGVVCAIILTTTIVVGVIAIALRRSAVTLAERLLRRLPFVSAVAAAQIVLSLRRGIRVVRRPRRFALALMLSAVVWSVTGLSILVLYPAFGLPYSSASVWLILVATSLAMTVPSTAGGLGVYEAAVVASLVAFGSPGGIALSFAIVLHAANLLPLVLTGVFAAWSVVAMDRKRAQRPESG